MCCAAAIRRSATISFRSTSARRRARDDVPGAVEHTIPVKPIADFAARWEACWRAPGQCRGCGSRWSAAAPAVSSSLCRRNIASERWAWRREVALVTRDALLPSHNRRVRRLFERIFAERGIAVLTDSPVIRVEPGALRLRPTAGASSSTRRLWVTEAGAAPWLAETGLPLTEGGFVAIDETLRSPADPRVFAAGDVATMTAHPREKAGVYAVRQGPPLAANLRRALAGKPLAPRRAAAPRAWR